MYFSDEYRSQGMTPDLLLQLREMELDSLLGIIRAINSNQSEEELYRIFRFTLMAQVRKSLLYVHEEDHWEYKVSHGTKYQYSGVQLTPDIENIQEFHRIDSPIKYFDEFDFILPIKHKSLVLAYLFVSFAEKAEHSKGMIKELVNFVEALANVIIVAVENKKLARKEQRQKDYRRQLDFAKEVQLLLFPKELPDRPDLTVAASYRPHLSIGGDYYDFIPVNQEHFLICIADVSGKGLPAALIMSNFQAGLRTLSKHVEDLSTIVCELNQLIMSNARGEHFITAFFMSYDVNTKRLEYINAGHNPPFLFVKDEVKRLDEGTTLLGAFDTLPMLSSGVLENMDDFYVFCFTDGFTEARNATGEDFGEASLQTFLMENRHLSPREVHAKLMTLLGTFTFNETRRDYVDDITLLSCRVRAY